ncbi:hypothetical protein [Treponema socranskii]|uniref:hypothetical protein n=1 Tax=Treponema socranskii TaxID=53419 RepID=UPI0028E6E476|nr:hypothetical protein [Treponema socranskii]
MFENVNYTFYSDTLGRADVPTEAEFNKYKLENLLFIKRLLGDGLIVEREENGIDSAVCMMIEVDYKAAQIATGEALPALSESIGSFSHSENTKAYDTQVELNAKSVEQQKYRVLSLFCDITAGRL